MRAIAPIGVGCVCREQRRHVLTSRSVLEMPFGKNKLVFYYTITQKISFRLTIPTFFKKICTS